MNSGFTASNSIYPETPHKNYYIKTKRTNYKTSM